MKSWNMSIRIRLTLFTIGSLAFFLGISLFMMNQSTRLTIKSTIKPLEIAMKDAISLPVEFEAESAQSFVTTIEGPDNATPKDITISSSSFSLDSNEIIKAIKLKPANEKIPFLINATTSHIQYTSYWIFLILVLAGGFWVYFLSGKILAPVNTLADEMKNRTIHNLNQPLEVSHASKEIKNLSDSFNLMLENLNQSFEIQKRFNASAAHELRTPIAILQTNLDALEEDNCNTAEDYKQFLVIAKRTVFRMHQLIENLLQMTKMETVEKTESICLNSVIFQALRDLEQSAGKKGVTVSSSLPKEDSIVMGKESLIYTAVFNLLDNAVKYNKENGMVKIYLSNLTDGFAEIIVSDTGIGIPENEIEAIFQPFYRVEKSRARSLGGAGMGLCLVKNITKLHGGYLETASEEGKGSCFKMYFPRRTQE